MNWAYLGIGFGLGLFIGNCVNWYTGNLYRKTIAIKQMEIDAKQATIDALMLEYCPSDMTKHQLEIWGAHQQPRRTCDFPNCPVCNAGGLGNH